MSNILESIVNIYESHTQAVPNLVGGNNRATNLGDGLEQYVKESFINGAAGMDEQTRNTHYSNIFSYQGSATRPPDLMLKGGDAIEVKKTQSIASDLQLNSSHPKCELRSTSPLINIHCRDCETWTRKDMIYVVGHVRANVLSSIWMVYGSIYAADESVYTDLKAEVTNSLNNTPNVQFSATNELGRINFVDPLRITNMRIRGMWLLQPPIKAFDYIYDYDDSKSFQLVAVIPDSKYQSFPSSSRTRLEQSQNSELKIANVNVKDPNNPVNLIPCKLITVIQA